jgi:hypothetical protein
MFFPEGGNEPVNVQDIITLARKHVSNFVPTESSARICLADAVRLFDAEDYPAAERCAIRSLRYSVGIHHADYKRATKGVNP